MAQYQYDEYVFPFAPKYRGSFQLNGVGSDYAARLFFWQADQRTILPHLQQYIDMGWEPVSEVGPAAYTLHYYKSFKAYGCLGGIFLFVFIVGTAGLALFWLPFMRHDYAEATDFRVKMRKVVA